MGQALAVVATTILIVELGEFVLLTYVWLFTTDAKVASTLDNLVVLGTTLVTICATSYACIASLISLGLRRAWPTAGLFVGIELLAAITQAVFLVIGMISFDGAWLRDFFDSKQPSFAAGMVSALVLVAVEILVRPWQAPSTSRV